jgi:hypothetical protein
MRLEQALVPNLQTTIDRVLDVHFTSPVPVYGLLGARASSPLLKQAGRLRSQGTGSEFTKQTSRPGALA